MTTEHALRLDSLHQATLTRRSVTALTSTATFGLLIAALWNTAGHYVFALWFLLSSTFFPRLISAVAHWMSAILAHMVWP